MLCQSLWDRLSRLSFSSLSCSRRRAGSRGSLRFESSLCWSQRRINVSNSPSVPDRPKPQSEQWSLIRRHFQIWLKPGRRSAQSSKWIPLSPSQWPTSQLFLQNSPAPVGHTCWQSRWFGCLVGRGCPLRRASFRGCWRISGQTNRRLARFHLLLCSMHLWLCGTVLGRLCPRSTAWSSSHYALVI